jgi:hypothetical protein
MAPGESERIGELLVEEGVVTQEEVAKALSEGGMKGTALAAVLEGTTHARRADLAAFLATDFRIPTLEDLRKVNFPQTAAKLVPEDLARKHEMVPVAQIGNLLCVAKPNYFNRAAVQELRRVSSLKVKILQADENQVRAAIERIYKGKKGDLPAPKSESRRPETTVFRATPPAVEEEAAFEAIPLISMSEEEAPAVPRSRTPAPRPAAVGGDLEDIVEIMDAIRIPEPEYAAALRDPFTKLVIDFDDLFKVGKAVPPYRVL